MWALSSLSLHGCQRSWEGLRLVTEQGKQLALNSERIASLYGIEGYRLAPNRYSRDSGAKLLPLATITQSERLADISFDRCAFVSILLFSL